ncbi:MAG: hypothetical protein KDE59_01785 [Anaerolineales bacterium]|nr:hypothetical protein [Anaerolineales bacterium]
MTLPELLTLLAGLAAELLWLDGRPLPRPAWLQPPGVGPRWLREVADRYQVWLWALLVVLLAFGLEQLPIGQTWLPWLDPVFTGIMVLVLLFILYHGILGQQLLPRVNEGKMFLVHVVVMTTLLSTGRPALPAWLVWLTIIPTIALFWQALWPRRLSLTAQAIFYLWYLLTLLLLAIQNSNPAIFSQNELNSFEFFAFICLFVFLALHVLLGLRFAAISLSLVLPRNRPLLQLIMPNLIQPKPLSRRLVLLFTGLALGLFALNRWLDLGSGLTLTNVLVLFAIQFDEA